MANNINSRFRYYRFHYRHAHQANKVLAKIESAKGKTRAPLVWTCKEYATEVLGSRWFAPWLYVYAAIAGSFKDGWIPDNYYESIVIPRINGKHGGLSLLKSLNSIMLSTDSFPDLLSYANGICFDVENNIIAEDKVKEFLFANGDKIVFKPDGSHQGRGILFFEPHSFSVEEMRKIGNGLFQSYVKQHHFFEQFAAAVATLRMTTVSMGNGSVSLRACYLRLGSGSDTHVQSASHVRVSIDRESGAFDDIGYLADWFETAEHPNSRVRFSNNYVPQFSECVRLVCEMHKKVPFVRCIGWDVVIDANEEVRILEWNGHHNDIKFSEATQGPCFADLGWERLHARSISS